MASQTRENYDSLYKEELDMVEDMRILNNPRFQDLVDTLQKLSNALDGKGESPPSLKKKEIRISGILKKEGSRNTAPKQSRFPPQNSQNLESENLGKFRKSGKKHKKEFKSIDVDMGMKNDRHQSESNQARTSRRQKSEVKNEEILSPKVEMLGDIGPGEDSISMFTDERDIDNRSGSFNDL